jgi:hypothetical protein
MKSTAGAPVNIGRLLSRRLGMLSIIGAIMTATPASRGPETKPEAAIAAPPSDATYFRREQSVMRKRYYEWWVKLGHALNLAVIVDSSDFEVGRWRAYCKTSVTDFGCSLRILA